MKWLLSLIVLTNLSICSAQDIIDHKTEIIYYLKIYNRDYNTTTFLKTWLEKFDPSYKTYVSNEFKLTDKINEARNEIAKLIEEAKFERIFYGTSDLGTDGAEVQFGEYDFNKKQFQFMPLTSKYEKPGDISYAINEYNYFWNNARVDAADFHSTEIRVLNHRDFIGLPLLEESAKKLLDERTESNGYRTYIDRKLFIKYYYSILNTKRQMPRTNYSNEKDLGMSAYVYRMEVWEDACMTENKIAVLEAKSPVPTILKSVALDFNKQYYSGKRTIMDTLQLQRGWIKLIDDDYMYKYNDECFYSLYQMNLSIVPTSPTLFDLKFMIKTNACVYFKQNYLYTFITSDKSEFPLAVSNLGNETYDGVTEMVATVKISKETLSQILSRKLTVLRVQLNGSPVSPGSMNFKKSEPCVKMGGHEWLGFTINDINRIRFEDLVRKVL